MVWLKNAEYLNNFVIKVWFNDGSVFNIDLKDSISGGVFQQLQDVKVFSKVKYNPDLETIYWENGADFAPEFLYQLAQKQNSAGSSRSSLKS